MNLQFRNTTQTFQRFIGQVVRGLDFGKGVRRRYCPTTTKTIATIKVFLHPNTPPKLREFSGMISYYHRILQQTLSTSLCSHSTPASQTSHQHSVSGIPERLHILLQDYSRDHDRMNTSSPTFSNVKNPFF
ncbi:hypothetical protein Pcinc_022550 [Petrolisthes cinctipes]|uniref:Uncharacterized protein n=1 Tax=Petrolisthes cinctipes TaxID=88211 RepID=A0AAE1KGI9_PETCI|nr:hypothetical protein Pcinc_022550 [Petrolisthes cinctipes]